MDYLDRVPDKDVSEHDLLGNTYQEFMNEKFPSFTCVDCNMNTHAIHEYYMVTPEIWRESGMKYDDGMLCIGCLENRIGRKLLAGDFPPMPINVTPFHEHSLRLQERLNSV